MKTFKKEYKYTCFLQVELKGQLHVPSTYPLCPVGKGLGGYLRMCGWDLVSHLKEGTSNNYKRIHI